MKSLHFLTDTDFKMSILVDAFHNRKEIRKIKGSTKSTEA